MLIPEFLPHGFAFVDIETTGGSTQSDSITEIGIIEADATGVREWSSLVRPAGRIPEHIERLTGISNAMVASAPTFAELADTVFDRLEGRLFVAHNARFDYGHLRSAFRRLGLDLRPRILCTVKLSRRMFPEQARHSLDHLIARHGFVVADRHRALGDAQVLWQFWQRLHERFPRGPIEQAVRDIIGRPALPAHLDANVIDEIPETPGVYLFHGDNGLPLYIGKSKRMRSRVLAHFSGDHDNDRELRLTQQVRRVSWIGTAGEIGALLKEAELIKRLQPIHNRQLRRNRDLCAWRLGADLFGDPVLELIHADQIDPARDDQLYGLFRSRRAALTRLRELAREHALCPTLLGLDKREAGGRCFTFQLRHCRGACVGREDTSAHTLRVNDALRALKIEGWPYPGAVGIREGKHLHVIDGWRYLGTLEDDGLPLKSLGEGRASFDLDIYGILVRAFAATEPELLGPRSD